jgi:hypothetical protein
MPTFLFLNLQNITHRKQNHIIGAKHGQLITNLTYNELIMKIVRSSFIYRFIHFTCEYNALKTCLTHT